MVSETGEFVVNNIAYQRFVAGDGFNIYELTCEADDIHGKKDSARPATGKDVAELRL
jgi:hypothetical protein